MNKLTIYTRSYIKDDGTWSLMDRTIKSIKELLMSAPFGSFHWVVLVSNQTSPIKNTEFDDLYAQFPDLICKLTFIDKLSSGQARQCLFDYFAYVSDIYPELSKEFLMCLDDDDELINVPYIVEFIQDNSIEFNDLVGYGMEISGDSYLMKECHWDIDKFNYSRRYITTETQAWFEFLHRISVVKKLLQSGLNLSKCESYPYENAEDTYVTISVSEYNNSHKDNPILLDAICGNFHRYNIYEGQTSSRQTKEEKQAVKDKLLNAGYLYVTGKFIKFNENNKLEEFTPIKPINKL